jgi:tetratricopeptide (TPR) repeat protein
MPEKPINDCPRELRPLFTKGSEALQRENYEYAIDLFNQVLAREPALIDVRRALRKAQAGKTAQGGGGFFKKMMSSAGSSPQIAKAQFALRSNPAEALALAEHALAGDATNAMAHRIVVEAATALDYPQTALMSLEHLLRHSPKDKAVAIQLANLLADNGDVQRAERLLVEFARAHPADPEVAQAVKDVSAKRTLSEGGYGALESGEGSYRDILRNEQEAVSLEQEKRVQKTEDVAARLIGEYEERIKREPGNMKLYRDLAELCTQKKQFDRALGYYARIKNSEMGGDASLDQAIAHTTVRKIEHQIEQLDPNADNHAEEVARLNAEKAAFQIAECQKRVEKFPTDLSIRFEMGLHYFNAGRIGEAIKEFQRSRENPHKRIGSMSYLAQCFARRKMFDLAAENLQEAIKEKPVFDDEKKDLVYQLGVVLDSMGRKPEAIEQFKLIYKLDASYRDVEARVDAFYAGQ